MKNQRLLFQQKAPWDWVADRVGMPDISPGSLTNMREGLNATKLRHETHNLLMIWVNLWLNAPSLASLRVF